MLKREIEEQLKVWKNKTNKKSLIISGAKQVGKTYLIEHFAKDNYTNFVELNFVETPSLKKIFDGDLDIDTLISNITLYSPNQSNLVPNKTLIFLDGIQACPNAITALKFFTIDKRFDVIATESFLGTSKDVPSYPTGYVEFLEINPLSFKEFLWANNVNDEIINYIKECFENRHSVNEATNYKLLELFKQYIVIGGMPNVVNAFIHNHNYKEALSIQKSILKDYQNDVSKYATSTERAKIQACLASIPGQLSKENKKFKYQYFDKNGKRVKYEKSLNFLIDSKIVNVCNNVKALDTPLLAYKDDLNFKLYMVDTGLLVSMLDEGTNIQIMEGNLGTYKGAILENVIAQILNSNDNKLYFYNRNNSLEIAFLLSKNNKVFPIEVKTNTKAKALSVILNENPSMQGYKLVYGNVSVVNNTITLPLYMAMFL